MKLLEEDEDGLALFLDDDDCAFDILISMDMMYDYIYTGCGAASVVIIERGRRTEKIRDRKITCFLR